MQENVQMIYINMDDSGVLHRNENYCVYGGIVFVGKDNRDAFIRKYNSTINKIKCSYCRTTRDKCKHICPEVKDTNIYPNHMRRLLNLLKKEFCYAVVINNQKLKEHVMKDKYNRGRFRDYTQKRIIKNVISELIITNVIDPKKPIKLVIRIDQQGTSTASERAFENDIFNELVNGTVNYNYSLIFKPIIFSELEIDLKYVLSHKHVCIQASDFIAGETRKIIIDDKIAMFEKMEKLEFLNTKILLP